MTQFPDVIIQLLRYKKNEGRNATHTHTRLTKLELRPARFLHSPPGPIVQERVSNCTSMNDTKSTTTTTTTPLAEYVAKLQAAHASSEPTTDQVCGKKHPRRMRSAKAKERMEQWKKTKTKQEEEEEGNDDNNNNDNVK